MKEHASNSIELSQSELQQIAALYKIMGGIPAEKVQAELADTHRIVENVTVEQYLAEKNLTSAASGD